MYTHTQTNSTVQKSKPSYFLNTDFVIDVYRCFSLHYSVSMSFSYTYLEINQLVIPQFLVLIKNIVI